MHTLRNDSGLFSSSHKYPSVENDLMVNENDRIADTSLSIEPLQGGRD